MIFIEVKDWNGQSVIINTDYIVSITEAKERQTDYTRIMLVDGLVTIDGKAADFKLWLFSFLGINEFGYYEGAK